MESAPRVNGRLMSSYMGRSVTLIGEVIQGSVPALKTGDGQRVAVQLPAGEYLEGAFSQVVGKVVGDMTISAMKITPVSSDFDMDIYESLVELSNGAHRDLFM